MKRPHWLEVIGDREYLHDLEHEVAAMAALAERERRSPTGLEARSRLSAIYRALRERQAQSAA